MRGDRRLHPTGAEAVSQHAESHSHRLHVITEGLSILAALQERSILHLDFRGLNFRPVNLKVQ